MKLQVNYLLFIKKFISEQICSIFFLLFTREIIIDDV